ncbi:MAG: amidohydrolase [Syntrophaceae bacterium]|nr:amidohydrolase [Syntrophaceae bacterium]
MMRIIFFSLSALLMLFWPVKALTEELPIFDAHIHYNQPDWSLYSPEKIFGFLDQAGVRWAIVSSTPDEGTLRLFGKGPKRIIPVLRPYRTQDDMGTWMKDSSILPYVEKRLERGIYRGIGEFHISHAEIDSSAVVRGFAEMAAARGLFLYTHTDESGVEKLLRLYPQVRILWAHAGMSATPQRIGQLLVTYQKLSAEISIRGDIAPGGRLDLAWRDLFLSYSDRFLIGSDTYVTSRWESFLAIHAEYRSWLSRLPREAAEKLAFRNALQLIGKGKPE